MSTTAGTTPRTVKSTPIDAAPASCSPHFSRNSAVERESAANGAEALEREDRDDEQGREAPCDRRRAEKEVAEQAGAVPERLQDEVDGRQEQRPAEDRADAAARDRHPTRTVASRPSSTSEAAAASATAKYVAATVER